MKKKDIYKLKKCLRDFKTKDHLCLFLDLLSFECLSKIDLSCLFFLFFCFLYLVLSIIILGFFLCSKFLDPLDFSSCPLALFGHL
jgi:hypothetical protein